MVPFFRPVLDVATMKPINQKHGIHVGDLVKYMSRTVLVVDIDEEWVYGIELGETIVGKYKHNYMKAIK